MGRALSESGTIAGPWKQDKEPLFGSDGGHGMIFRAFGGERRLALHAPNEHPLERPEFLPLTKSFESETVRATT